MAHVSWKVKRMTLEQRAQALEMMKSEAAKLEFHLLHRGGVMYVCKRCAAMVEENYLVEHCGWHDEVLSVLQGLVTVADAHRVWGEK